jgi:hypothetical protein
MQQKTAGRLKGWYWDDTPGTTTRSVLSFWNGRWWSARAHKNWDAETAGRQALIKAPCGPAAFTPAFIPPQPKPKLRRLTPEEAQELRDGIVRQELRVNSLEADLKLTRQRVSDLQDLIWAAGRALLPEDYR